ncbi:MAG: oligosaccharide flippase family protein, partial [Lachnospiraceae bacterium]|nr:oligosaccharide flippase family protein [Lachnospiraceae bacterium]
MESRSRTEHSARNSSVALISQLIHLLVGFLLRIVFTHTLSKDYVGVNGLFLDIIFILSLSELGVGTAITYALYGPIEEGDIEKQKSLMQLFRRFYHLVACIVLGLGLLLIPFMDIIIKDPPNVEHLTVIYLFYLASAVSSYLMIYKRTLMDAHQLAYIGTLYTTGSWVIQDLIQILVLVFTHNFLLYLAINLVVTITTNILISRKADALYPYLKDKNVAPLPQEEKQEIRKNVGAMFLHKMSNVVVNNTDNLLISAFVGIVSVGKYSNYVLITASLRNIVRSFFQGIMASVGNLGVSKERGRLARIFHATLFINQWVSCFAAVSLFEIFNLFVALFFGEQYVFEVPVVAMICLNFYLGSLREGILVFRDSLGVFWYDRYKAIAEAVVNLVVSIILARYLGTAGVLLGTVISTLTTSAWVEPYMLYKYRLQTSLWEFWKRILCYVPVAAGVLFLTDWVCSLYEGTPWLMLLYRIVICLVVPNVLLFIMYCRNRELQFLAEKAKELLRARMRKTQSTSLSKRDLFFLQLLRSGLNPDVEETFDADVATVHAAIIWARNQGLITFAHEYLYRHDQPELRQWMPLTEPAAKQMVMNNYRLWQQTLHLHQLFEQRQIPYLLLKGPSVSSYFDVPELRKS